MRRLGHPGHLRLEFTGSTVDGTSNSPDLLRPQGLLLIYEGLEAFTHRAHRVNDSLLNRIDRSRDSILGGMLGLLAPRVIFVIHRSAKQGGRQVIF